MVRDARFRSGSVTCALVVAAGLVIAAAAHAQQSGRASGDPAKDRLAAPAIVTLETRAGRVTIYAGELGRYYSIVTKDGRVVAERISGDELTASHPDVAATVDRGMAVQMADLPQ